MFHCLFISSSNSNNKKTHERIRIEYNKGLTVAIFAHPARFAYALIVVPFVNTFYRVFATSEITLIDFCNSFIFEWQMQKRHKRNLQLLLLTHCKCSWRKRRIDTLNPSGVLFLSFCWECYVTMMLYLCKYLHCISPLINSGLVAIASVCKFLKLTYILGKLVCRKLQFENFWMGV